MNNKKILFINYDLGFNLGYIPYFLTDNYKHVILCGLYFKDTKHKGESFIKIYKEGNLVNKKSLITNKSKNYFKSIFSYIHYFFIIYNIKRKHGVNYLFSPNPIFVFFGIILNFKTVYIVGDIMRLDKSNPIYYFIGLCIQYIIKFNIKKSYYVWFISNSLHNYFNTIDPNRYIVSTMGIKTKKQNSTINKQSKPLVLYIGGFDESKGINIIFKVAKEMQHINFVLIGDSKISSKKIDGNITIYPPTIDDDLDQIILNENFIGIAPYIKDHISDNYLGDPTKIKQYLSYYFPVITTKHIEFSMDIEKYNAGISIEYSKEELKESIEVIYKSYYFYKKNVQILADKYRYTDLYKDIFSKILN